MKNFKMLSLFTLIVLILLSLGTSGNNPPQKQLTVEEKIDSIINIMTLQEKIGQLHQLSYGIGFGPEVKRVIPNEIKELIGQGKIGSLFNAAGSEFTRELQEIAVKESRLKIPLIFGLDVIHGFKATFPVPIAEASSWDPKLVELASKYAALEASSAGIHWTFAPMVDIARDPRWGRIVEGSGEDPYLGSIMSAARVKGFQGNLSNENILACAKHFAAYGGAEGGRDYNTVDISEMTLRNIYLPPFKAALDAGAGTFMCSFNEINGIPSSANKQLLTKILRDEWKFEGFVVSDWNSIGELIPHGIAADMKEAALLGLKAGVDMDMESRCYTNELENLLKEGKISLEEIELSVRRILRMKYKLGLFEDPFKYCSKEAETKNILSEEVQKAALETAQRSIVLLKNEGNLLPLKKDLKKIAVIGPLADNSEDPLGPWAAFGNEEDVITVLEGIKKEVSKNTEIIFSEGCKVKGDSKDGFKEAVETAKASDAVILVLGEERDMSGESNCRYTLDLPGVQEDLVKEIQKTGKPIVVVLMNGRPLSINWIDENIPSILEAWFLGIKSGPAIADVLFGDYNPSGKLPVTFPRAAGQIPNYYNHKSTGRPGSQEQQYTSRYVDLTNSPLYPFGYGLSYTKFFYGNIKLSKSEIRYDEMFKAEVEVTNTGNRDGEEVVQLYIRDVVGSVTRPVKELKGFKKIFLAKGETKKVEFEISSGDLRYYNADNKFTAEPGVFKVYIGTNSSDVKEAEFKLER